MTKTTKTIAIGGFQHETNTFAPTPARYEDFVQTDGWPGLSRADDLFPNIKGVHIPITGAYEYLQQQKDVRILPLLWASATPSAQVSEHAFETITEMFIEDLNAMRNEIDGVYLDLHGAMVCDHLQDGEGEFLKRIRSVIGDIPLTISLDLHANVTPEMVERCDYIDIFRTYPHVDMALTGQRAAEELMAILHGADKRKAAFRQLDFIIPLCDGCTLFGAGQEFYEIDLIAAMQKDDIKASAAFGFPLADIYHMGSSIVTYGHSQSATDNAADELIAAMANRFRKYSAAYFSPQEAIGEAQKTLAEKGGPIVIADIQDSPGGGGTGDTTTMLRTVIASSIKSAVFACISDPDTAAQLHRHKIGDTVSVKLGGKRFPGDTPYEAEAKILNLADGKFVATGPMWKGSNMELGPMALIAIGNTKIIIQSQNEQTGDTSILRHLGIEPTEEEILVLKTAVHYRADFQPFAKQTISVIAPGACYAHVGGLNFKNIRPELDLKT